jgi:hypothetical protein
VKAAPEQDVEVLQAEAHSQHDHCIADANAGGQADVLEMVLIEVVLLLRHLKTLATSKGQYYSCSSSAEDQFTK